MGQISTNVFLPMRVLLLLRRWSLMIALRLLSGPHEQARVLFWSGRRPLPWMMRFCASPAWQNCRESYKTLNPIHWIWTTHESYETLSASAAWRGAASGLFAGCHAGRGARRGQHRPGGLRHRGAGDERLSPDAAPRLFDGAGIGRPASHGWLAAPDCDRFGRLPGVFAHSPEP